MEQNTNDEQELENMGFDFGEDDLGAEIFSDSDLEEVRTSSRVNPIKADILSYKYMKKRTPFMKGNPYGIYEDKIAFLGWVLKEPYLRDAPSYFKTAMEYLNDYSLEYLKDIAIEPYFPKMFFSSEGGLHTNDKLNIVGGNKMGITVEFLRSLSGARKTNDFFKRSDYNTRQIRHCYKQFYKSEQKDLNEVISAEEYDKHMAKLRDHIEIASEISRIKQFPKSTILGNFMEKKSFKVKPEFTESAYKASERLRNKGQRYLTLKCGYCGDHMKFPLMKNGDHSEKFAWEIYQNFLNSEQEYKGKSFLCKHCLENKWNVEGILKLLESPKMPKVQGTKYGLPLEKFCRIYRTNRKVPTIPKANFIAGPNAIEDLGTEEEIDYPKIRKELRIIFSKKDRNLRASKGKIYVI